MPAVGKDGNCLFLARSKRENRFSDVRVYIDVGGPFYFTLPEAYLTDDGRQLRGRDGSAAILPRENPFVLYDLTGRQYRSIANSGYPYQKVVALIDRMDSRRLQESERAAAS